MNEKYIKQLYDFIGGKDAGFDYDAFKNDISTNEEYNKEIFDYAYGEQEGIDYNAYAFDTGLKKKEQPDSGSSQEPTPSSEDTSTPESVGTPSVDISKLGYSWGESTLTPDKELKGDVVQYSQSTTSDIVDVPEKPKSLTPKEDELRNKMDANDALILEIDESLDRTRNRDLGDNNAQIQRRKREEERQGLLKEQESLSSEYLQPTLEKALSGIISEDGSVDESFLTQNVYGFTTPDLDKVRGVVDDNLAFDRFKPKLQKEITSAIDFAVNAPKEKVTSKADEIFKKETGQSFDEAMKSDASKAFNDKYSKEILQANASVKAYASQVGSNYSKEIKAREVSVTGQLDVLSKDYEEAVAQIRSMAEGATDQKEIDKLNSELERVNKEYNATAFKLSEEYQDEANELMSRANRDIQDRVEEVNGQVRNLTDKFAQEYGAPKEVVQKYQEAMSKAAAEVYAGSIYGKKGVINLLEDRSPLSNRVITSMLSSFGGALQGMANGVGYEAEWAQDMQQYFQPSIDPIKGFKDITLDKLQESSGNLLGSMIPSLTASIGTAVVTKNAPMAVRIAATGLAGWSSETLDLSGRAYRTALEKSGSEEVARSAASETIDSQLLLMPTYALDALPFVGAFKGIRNPILRVGTGGVVEYVQEFTQEYPQNLAEKAISETGRYNTMWDNISKESMQETAANLLPVALLGGGGAISQDTSVKDGKDYILNIIDKGGKESAMLVAASLYNDGKIDKDTYESLGEFIDSVDDTNSLDYNKVLEELKDVATAAIEETDPVKKSILKEKEKELEAKAESILTGVPLEESTEGIGYNNPKNTRFNEKLSGETETKETPVKEDTGKYTAQPTEELEQRMSELENSKDKKERDEFNEIEKELENREWGSVINAPLSEVESTVDELVEKEKSMPNGFGSFIEKADATETKEVAKKYSGEVSKADAKKDFDKAFNGSPSTWYADALKLKESVRVFIEQGGTFKELLQGQATEYTKDGFTEEEAASVIGRKLEDIKRQTDKSQQESQVEPDLAATESKDVVTPEILEQGKKEVTDVTKGTFSTANPVKIFKGIGGKKDLQGFRINAHKGAKGVFSSVDSELAATYGRDEGVAEVVIPKGTSIEVVEVDGTGMGMSDYRAAEVKAINNSDAQIVKLITIDGVMKAGEKRQQQYVIKDDSLIEGLKKEESPTSTKDKVSTQEKAETRDDSEPSPVKKSTPNEEGVFMPSGESKIKDGIKRFRKRYLSARSFLPRSVFAAKESKEANIAQEMHQMEVTKTSFDRALKNYKGDEEILVKSFDRFVRGEEVELPDEFIEIGNQIRNQIDGLSTELINSGYVTEFQKESIKKNIGEYLTRSYAVFDKNNWKEKVQEEVKQKARNFLKDKMLKTAIKYKETSGVNESVESILDDMVDARMDEILTEEGAGNFIKGSKLGAKDSGVLKRRKDIPFEIRALMGEYADPIQNYAKTIFKMSNLLANAKFLAETKERGMGVFLFEKDAVNRPMGFNTEIASEGSDSMNPLNGLYTTPEIAKEFEADQKNNITWLQHYMGVISTVKWAKTIGSFTTQVKNVIGGLGFMAANGHWRVGEINNAYKVVRDDIFSMKKKELTERMNRYIGLGIVKQSTGVGEIRDMFSDAGLDERVFESMNKRNMSSTEKFKRGALRFKKKAEDVYQGVDDMFKIVAYENELSRYSKALFGKPKSELSQKELDQIDPILAEIVKNTYPTYSRVPEAIQMIRRFPFVGNFVSFQAEAWRTAYNTVDLAWKEVKSDNKEIRKIGAQRLVGVVSYEVSKDAMLWYFGSAAGVGMSGIAGALFNSDDEDERDKDVRKFVAPWSKSSDLIMLDVGGGKIQYIDFSSSDPHGGIRKVFNAFAMGNDSIDSYTDGLYQVIEPFVGEEIATRAIRSVLSNQNSYGKPIFNPEDTKAEIIKDISIHIYKTLELGTLKTLRKIYGSDSPTDEFIASMFGFRVYDVDISKVYGYKMNNYKERISNVKRIYNSKKYNDKSTPEEKREAYDRANELYKKIITEMRDVTSSAIRLGTNPKDLRRKMEQNGRLNKSQRSALFGAPINNMKP